MDLKIVALSVMAVVFSAGHVVAEDDPFKPTPEEFQVIHDCLEASRDASARDVERDCVGSVANPCIDKPENQSTQGMAGCGYREEAIWDALLNDWYGSAREFMSAPLRGEFRDVQRQWITWRDAKCGFERAKFEGGTMGIPIAAICLMETTARRALEVRDLVREFESR